MTELGFVFVLVFFEPLLHGLVHPPQPLLDLQRICDAVAVHDRYIGVYKTCRNPPPYAAA